MTTYRQQNTNELVFYNVLILCIILKISDYLKIIWSWFGFHIMIVNQAPDDWRHTSCYQSRTSVPDVDIGWNCHALWKYPVWTRGTFLDNSTLPSFQSTTPTTWVTSFNWLVFVYPVIACAYHSCLFKFSFFTSNSFPIQSYGIYCVCRPLRLVYFH